MHNITIRDQIKRGKSNVAIRRNIQIPKLNENCSIDIDKIERSFKFVSGNKANTILTNKCYTPTSNCFIPSNYNMKRQYFDNLALNKEERKIKNKIIHYNGRP